MTTESKLAFFRQSGWLVISTAVSGVFLMAVYSVLPKMPDLGVFLSMLRLFTVLAIFTSGLQVVVAQDTAAVLTEEARRKLAISVKAVARGILLFWSAVTLLCIFRYRWIVDTLQIGHAGTLAVTLGLFLAQLFLPFVQGLLQGAQNFAWLGWSIMLNGAGRFVAILLLTRVLGANATVALTGALLGLGSAVFAAFWPSRSLVFSARSGTFGWWPWLKRAIPLSAGAGSILFLMNADVLFVQAHFPREQTAYYSAVAIIGVGLVTFTTPMASVMFPKLVRSVAQAQRSDSLLLALAGTALLGLSGALLCSIWPTLPLRIMFFRNPDLLKSARLVPWFMWGMLPMTMANVLVGGLLAKKDFRAVPIFLLIAVGYGLEMHRYLSVAKSVELFTAFEGVIVRLGAFGLLMAVVAAAFSFRPQRASGMSGKEF